MCSQRLTRPGRLCRECERELDRERVAADGLAAVIELPDSPATDREAAWPAAVRSRPAALITAFVIGIGIAAGLYAAHGGRTTQDAGTSVMIDRDLSGIKPRAARAPAASATPAAPAAMTVAHSAPSYDRVLGLANALDRCSEAVPDERLACEGRARAAYCESAGAERISQCFTPR
jgi:hypothetical protein